MDPWPAIGVSFVSALVYHVSYRLVICCRIDDAVNAAAVHLASVDFHWFEALGVL